MIRAHVAENWAAMGVSIAIVIRSESAPPMILRLGEHGPVWEQVTDPTAVTEPTLQLGHEEARCGKIHKPVPMPGIQADSWHSPDDGHPYAPHYAAVPSAALVDRLTAEAP